MVQESQQNELCAQSQQLLQGRLKHTRTAALALALVPLAAVAVSTQVNEPCPSGGICGTVFFDENNNGVQDTNEPGIGGAIVTITYLVDIDGTPTQFTSTVPTFSEPDPTNPAIQPGVFNFGIGFPEGPITLSVQIPPDMTPATPEQGGDDAADSDGVLTQGGTDVAATFTYAGGDHNSTDFGFTKSVFPNPGTGTPGYWKNHPEAWPVQQLMIGGKPYTKAQAIAAMETPVAKDKTYTIFASLVSAMLNTHPLVGNDNSCVQSAIDGAQAWFVSYGPVGSKVAASSYAWKLGEPLHRQMDNYNNGMLCVQHRE